MANVTVYPCKCPEGHHLDGYPAEEMSVPKKQAEWLVATKAFSYGEDGQHEKWEPHESATWPPPTPDQTEAPADAGALDSSEE